MISAEASFQLGGAPDYLVTVALLYLAGWYLAKALAKVSVPNPSNAAARAAVSGAWSVVRFIPVAMMVVACLALAAGTLPAALRMIGL